MISITYAQNLLSVPPVIRKALSYVLIVVLVLDNINQLAIVHWILLRSVLHVIARTLYYYDRPSNLNSRLFLLFPPRFARDFLSPAQPFPKDRHPDRFKRPSFSHSSKIFSVSPFLHIISRLFPIYMRSFFLPRVSTPSSGCGNRESTQPIAISSFRCQRQPQSPFMSPTTPLSDFTVPRDWQLGLSFIKFIVSQF